MIVRLLQSSDELVMNLVALLISILTSIMGGQAPAPAPVQTTTMTAAVIIVTGSDSPNGYVVMDGESYSRAYSMVAALDTWVYDMSGGMGDVQVDVIEHEGEVPFTSSSVGGMRPDATAMRGQFGLYGYDAVIVIADSDADTVDDGYGGLAASYADHANIWVPSIPGGENHIVHEFGHGVETQLIARGYGALPWCGEASPIHCSSAFGYGWMASYEWMRAFYSGTVDGSLGVTQDGWRMLADG